MGTIVAPTTRGFSVDVNNLNKVTYDPEKEEDEMKFDTMVRSISHIERKDEADLLHGEDGGMIYKYDLPVVNQPITFHDKLVVVDKGEEKEMMT